MSTGSNAGDNRAELFVADFYPKLGEYLAERHASGYDAVAARVRFLSWLAQHVDQSAIRPPRADFVSPGDAMARDALTDYIAEGTVHAQLHGARRKLVAGLERYYPFGQDSGEGAIS